MNYRNPKYNENGTVDCEIEHPEYGWIPFTADPNDSEEHGRVMRQELEQHHNDPQNPTVIQAWQKPSDIVGEEAMARVRAKRDALLNDEVDPIVSNNLRWSEMTPEKQAEWSAYRQALLDLPQNSTPTYIYIADGQWDELGVTFPTKPE